MHSIDTIKIKTQDSQHKCLVMRCVDCCSYIMLVDVLSTWRVRLQIDGGSHAQLAGMRVSRDVSRRKLHVGLARNA